MEVLRGGKKMIKVVKNATDYNAVLATLEELIDRDPDAGTPEAEQLEILTLLVQDYESKRFHRWKPDPVEAIKFRMEQQDLTQRDLVPYIGSRSKVSEVLAGKRPLTLAMIRALHSNLGIPAEVLLKEGKLSDLELTDIVWERFPLREMIRRRWVTEVVDDVRGQAEEVLRRFFAPLGSVEELASLRPRTGNVRTARRIDRYALTAWAGRVVLRALENRPEVEYARGAVDLQFMGELARLSPSNRGPLLAGEYLKKHGISLVVERHLPRTHLDGAVIMPSPNVPVIGLTVRYDRIDHFWFCLVHELAHLALHFDDDTSAFYDDLDVDAQDDPLEDQADALAAEVLIPEEEWEKSPASRLRSPEAAEHLANKLGIHPAIVAGRMRHYFRAYRLLNNVVGHRQVRKLFPDVDWM